MKHVLDLPYDWYVANHWHDHTDKDEPPPGPTVILPPPPKELVRHGLDRFTPNHTTFSPWNGRPKRLHANDCPLWQATHHTDWANCCTPQYRIHNVADMDAVPRGYIPIFDPNPDLAALRQVEIDFIVGTQHARDCMNKGAAWNECCKPPEIAPEAMLLHERGLEAVELDNQPTDAPAVEIEYDPDKAAPYDTPSRAEQTLADWEKKSWYAGPILRLHWSTPDGDHLNITLDSLQHQGGSFVTHELSDEDKQAIIANILEDARKEGTKPTAAQLASDLTMVKQLRAEWGRKWFLHNPVNPGLNPHPFTMADMDDPYRNAFHDEDRTDRNLGYAGPVDLSYDLDDDSITLNQTVIITSSTGEEVALQVDDDDLYSNVRAEGEGLLNVGISGR